MRNPRPARRGECAQPSSAARALHAAVPVLAARLGLAVLLGLVAACGDSGHEATPGEAPPAAEVIAHPFRLTDVTASSGLLMSMTSGRDPASQILEVKGGGLALLDRDGDGDWDVFIPNGATLDSPERGPGARVFDNVGDGWSIRFEDVTQSAGVTFDRWGIGVAVGDVDGDGSDDVYITAFGPNALLRNDGAGKLVDVTAAAGVGDARWGTGCCFGDVDLDGDLDLYVTNYLDFDPASPPSGSTFKGIPVFGGPHGLPPQADVLYANDGAGMFTDVTAISGCGDVEPAHGLNALILDLDLDGRPEILVGNDSMPNRLFDDAPDDGLMLPVSEQGWTRRLIDRALVSGISSNTDGADQATMGFAVADVDGNGFPDIFSTNFSNDTNTLHLNADGHFFDDRTAQFGLGPPSRMLVGWAAGFHDFDLDGDEDLLVFNGHVYTQATRRTMDSEARQPPLLLERQGQRFKVVSNPDAGAWLTSRHVDRSAAFGDLDGDGDVDVLVGERNGPVRVLRNDGGVPPGLKSDQWLSVHLHDRRADAGNPRGLGSLVTLSWPGGEARRWIHSAGSYLAASEPVARFGLPVAARSGGLAVEVLWPDGQISHIPDPDPGPVLIERQ